MVHLLVGTYTRSASEADGSAAGIHRVRIGEGPRCSSVLAAATPNPSWLVKSADGRNVYAVMETSREGDGVDGAAVAFASDRATGTLRRLGSTPVRGDDPAHIALDPSERFLLTSNYGSGSVSVLPRLPDGRVGPVRSQVQHEGAGVDPVRQAAPHPHQTVFDPRSGLAFVPDLGLDRIVVYALADGRLVELPERALRVAPGAGPRHLAFHPGGEHLFVLNELDNTLLLFRREGSGFVPTCVLSTLPEDFHGPSQAAEVRISATGRTVFASNRGHDSIAVFAFESDTSSIERTDVVSTGGRGPRDFIRSEDGSCLYVAHEESAGIVSMAFDEASRALRPVTGCPVPTPVCLLAL